MRHALALEVQLDGQAATCAVHEDTGVLAVGTYQLDETSGNRLGAMQLFLVQQQEPDAGRSSGVSAHQAAMQPSAGVFELAWDPAEGSEVLGAALADGRITLWSPASREAQPELRQLDSCQAFDGGALCTTLAFQHGADEGRSLAVTGSAGDVVTLAQAKLW